MDQSMLVQPASPLNRLQNAVASTVAFMFALLATNQRLPAWMENTWADAQANMNPVKEIAIGFILIAISLVIALTILPVITSAVNTAAIDTNLSSADATLLRLLPTLLIVGLLAGGVTFLFQGFKKIRG